MFALKDIFQKIDHKQELQPAELQFLLDLTAPEEIQALLDKAYEVKKISVGTKVYFRGIVEFSNICEKDCYYCGIRKSNTKMNRFILSEDDIVESAVWAYNAGYGSIALQSGERSDKLYIDAVERVLQRIQEACDGKIGITISLGEQTVETYRRWFEAGAHRYLLRIETTNRELFYKIHPKDKTHHFETRIECLRRLKQVGYQVGTGVMIGLPFQSTEDLANDILFFKRMDIDMIGMGPYLFHHDTPLNQYRNNWKISSSDLLQKGLKMIAVTRIHLRDVNIAATTALQALDDTGREAGLKAGANIIMPNATNTEYRESYQLYENKPCMDENARQSRETLERRIEEIGESVGYNEWGDSPHAIKRLSI
jgi:biotin synthase